uniref:RNA polymerase alpha subunit n=1 Tax=Monomorphina parapyrum TaxID=1664066 RepID=A0A0G3VJR6_9EUGL|nr:RNA polymerase alpha subunit [Monomorphina parapyrum]AKL78935.1 RNA polymerase alpha subunit [Monomorphina parapyrum]
MKLLKIKILKNKKNNKSNYGLLKIESKAFEKYQILGNLIRRSLIKDNVRIRIKNIKFFLSKQKEEKEYDTFQPIDEFSDFEEINKPIYQISKNLKRIQIKEEGKKLLNTRNIATLNTQKKNRLQIKDIKFPKNIKVLNPSKSIFDITHNTIKLKILMEISVRLIKMKI